MPKNQIIHGDCLKVLGDLPPVRMVWADPPDNRNVKYDVFQDRWQSPSAYNEFLGEVMLGAIYHAPVFWLSCFHVYQPTVWTWYDRQKEFDNSILCRMFPWTYTFGQHRSDDCGNGYRPIFRFERGIVTRYTDAIREESQRQRNGDKRADPRGRVPDDVWNFSRVCGTFRERRKWFPCQHPEALVERMIRLSCRPGDTVIDMFAGSGVTNRVGPRCGVNVYAIDISGRYCKKIAEETGAELVVHESAAMPENPLKRD